MDKVRNLLLVAILFSSLFLNSVWALGEGYGEESESLGQFVDDFTDLIDVSVIEDIVRNSTYNAMELNYTVGGGGIDLTDWTEDDVDNDLIVNVTHVLFDTLRRDSASLIYQDFSADPFGDFMINYTLGFDVIEAGDTSNIAIFDSLMIGNGITNDLNRAGEMITIEPYQSSSTDNRVRWRIQQRKGGATTISILDTTVYTIPDIFYLSVYRLGATIGVRVFTDEAHTAQVEHLTSGGADLDTYDYVLTAIGYESAGDPADYTTGYVSDINVNRSTGGGYVLEGYFSTTDYLDYVDGSTLALMTNSTIPDGTGITVEFSENNSTWINETVLTEGFQSVDLRTINGSSSVYLRYSLTGIPLDTPRLYQSRLITTEGLGGGGGEPFMIFGLLIGLILGIGALFRRGK